MRRPLKPFITEYKGSVRRNPVGLREAVVTEALKSAPKPLDLAIPAELEDSYEAAMRAADALFAPQPARESAPAPEKFPAAEDGSPPSAPATSSSIARPAGRILRVIDEPPLPDVLALAALETERAPKRRGRKPGSKNKPKPAAPHTSAATVEDIIAALDEAPVASRHVASKPKPAAAAIRRVTALPAAAAPGAPGAPEKSGKRFSWVKDRLRPGEDWKRRRLPKVCW